MIELVSVHRFSPSEIEKNPKRSNYRKIYIRDERGQREVLSLDGEQADKLTPGPLPPGWIVEPGGTWDDGRPKSDLLRAPRTFGAGGASRGSGGGFQAAWRNTEAGQKYEQERMDRRTAAMQAVAASAPFGPEANAVFDAGMADQIYRWLRNGQ